MKRAASIAAILSWERGLIWILLSSYLLMKQVYEFYDSLFCVILLF